MKSIGFLAVILAILVIGGGLTAIVVSSGGFGSVLPVLQTVANPSGSTLAVTSQKAELLFLLIGFIVFNLVGMAVTLAIVFWFLHRGVKIAEKIEVPQSTPQPVKAKAAK